MPRKITPLDCAILGLIHDSPLSGYAIRQVFATTALGNFSGGQGTIYPALRRILSMGLVEKRRVGKKDRYHVSDDGKRRFKEWLRLPVTSEEVEKRSDLVVMRFSFMSGILPTAEIREFLETINRLTAEHIDKLQALRAEHLALFKPTGLWALDLGIEQERTRLSWGRRVLESLEEVRDDAS